jgi:hypothetical protein
LIANIPATVPTTPATTVEETPAEPPAPVVVVSEGITTVVNPPTAATAPKAKKKVKK